MQGRWCASRRPREGPKALIKDYGKPVDFKMLVTATPRGHRRSGAQQFWKRGRRQHGDRAGRPGDHPAARLHASVSADAVVIVDLADPDIQMFANFRSGSPVALANYSNPELRQAARAGAGHGRHRQAHRGLLRCSGPHYFNKEVIWFWTFEHLSPRAVERQAYKWSAENVQRHRRLRHRPE